MTERTAEVTLRIVYDDATFDHPEHWDWAALTDATDRSHVTVIATEGNTP